MKKSFITPGPGPTKCPDTPVVFPKELFLEQKLADTKNHEKYYPACK